jgi:hypothetical protein
LRGRRQALEFVIERVHGVPLISSILLTLLGVSALRRKAATLL